MNSELASCVVMACKFLEILMQKDFATVKIFLVKEFSISLNNFRDYEGLEVLLGQNRRPKASLCGRKISSKVAILILEFFLALTYLPIEIH